MVEIVLAATTGLGALGVGVLVYLLLEQRKTLTLRFDNARLDCAMLRVELADRQREIKATLIGHQADIADTIHRYEEDAAAARREYQRELEAARRDFAEMMWQLESDLETAQAAMEALQARYATLVSGHEFHIGGKAFSHGGECILYNCVTCPPEANVRILAPAGFFAAVETEVAE